MSLEEYEQITSEPDGLEVAGLRSRKTGKEFSARLVWDHKAKPYPKVVMKFDANAAQGEGAATGATVAHGGKAVPVVDHGDYYTVNGYRCRFFKQLASREMSAEDYARILSSSEPVAFDGFTSKRGNAFSAALRFNAKAKPYPKVEFVFED
jgi:hypothetical protein